MNLSPFPIGLRTDAMNADFLDTIKWNPDGLVPVLKQPKDIYGR
jgi:hypothetical protein